MQKGEVGWNYCRRQHGRRKAFMGGMRAVIPCFLPCVVALMLCVRMATVVELNTVQCVLLTGTARHMFLWAS
ncbi:retrotransposon hot spot (RHS) protein, putative, partial [Trypanosoma cruzi]